MCVAVFLVFSLGLFEGIMYEPFNDWAGGCNKFVPILGRNGTKIASAGDIFDQTPWSNAINSGQACRPCRGSCSPIP